MKTARCLIFLLLAPPLAAGETIHLTAEGAARRILEVSAVATAATERTAAAASAVKAAEAAVLPSISAAATVAERSSVPEYRMPSPLPGYETPVLVPNITETYSAQLRALQVIYSGGAITAQRRAAENDRAAVTAERDTTAADLKFLARSAYWEAVRTQATLAAAHAQEKRALQLVDDTKATFEAGLSVRADVLAAEERAARAKVQVIRATVAAENALSDLRSLLAIERASDIRFAALLNSPLPAAPASVEVLEKEALERRPEVKVLEAKRAVLAEREQLARAPGKPSVNAQAQYEYARPNNRYFPQAEEWKGAWAISLGAALTIFDGGKWRADVATAQASQRALENDLLELKRRIQVDVETVANNLAASLAAVVATDAAHAAAVESEKAAIERREAGLASLIEVLDAQGQLANAEQEQIQARAAAWLTAARLDRAAGR